MASNYSPEKWEPCCDDCSALFAGDVRIASFHADEDTSDEVMRANIARAAECVNACHGLDPAAIAQLIDTCESIEWLHSRGELTPADVEPLKLILGRLKPNGQ